VTFAAHISLSFVRHSWRAQTKLQMKW